MSENKVVLVTGAGSGKGVDLAGAALDAGHRVVACSASKFALEGCMECLTPEVAPFGISTMVVEPGFFRTDLLTPESTNTPCRPSRTTPGRPRPPGRA